MHGLPLMIKSFYIVKELSRKGGDRYYLVIIDDCGVMLETQDVPVGVFRQKNFLPLFSAKLLKEAVLI